MAAFASQPDLFTVTSHQCEYGLTTPGPTGEPMAALKPTRWLSNSKEMIFRLSRRCTRMHEHQQLTAGRARAAEIYPAELCVEILRGMRDTEDATFHEDDEDLLLLDHVAWVNSIKPNTDNNDTSHTTPNPQAL